MKNTFHKSERLCSRKQMEWLFEKGSSKNSYPIKMIYILNEGRDTTQTQAMFVVPKRKFKKAHDRNILKRRMREAYRLMKSDLYQSVGLESRLDIAFLYTSSKEETYQVIHRSVSKLLTILTEEFGHPAGEQAKN